MNRISSIFFGFVAMLTVSTVALAASPAQVINFQLRWHHQFQFAGYYAAVERGYYREEGLDVRLHEGAPGRTPVDEVLAGRAQYAESNSELLYGRMQGKPLVALAAIFQHSPSVLLAKKDSGIYSPHDLVGKKVMLMNMTTDADFLAMFLHEGVKPAAINIMPSSYDFQDLVSGKVDAINAYLTNEPYILKQRGIGYTVINPSTYGIDFYSDILFTTEQELKQHPERVEAFRRATLKGWRYAMDNPAEIIDLLITKYKVPKSRMHLQFEAEAMRSLILPDLVEMGHMNPGRWQRMADAFIEVGMGRKEFSLDGFIYDTTPKRMPGWVIPLLIVALLILATVSAAALYLRRINIRLTKAELESRISNHLLSTEISDRKEAESQLNQHGLALSQIQESIVICDNEYLVRYVNAAFTKLMGYASDEIQGKPLSLILPPESNTPSPQQTSAIAVSQGGFKGEVLRRAKNGKSIPVLLNVSPVKNASDEVTGFVGVMIDMTDIKKSQEELQLAASVLETSSNAVMVTSPDNLIISVNPAFTEITGYSPEEVLGKNPRTLSSGTHNKEFYRALWSSLTQTGTWVGEMYNRRKNGEIYVEWLSIKQLHNAKGDVINHVAIFSDISAQKATEKHLERLAHYDFLTGLPNRTLFSDRLQQAIAIAKREHGHVAVLFLDLDMFKPVNDTYGHHVGDLLLKQAAGRLLECVRESDTVCRLGGDEFVVLLSSIEGDDDAAVVAEKIRLALNTPFELADSNLQVSSSIGIAIYPRHGTDEEQLLKAADVAMYAAKSSGRNNVQVFNHKMVKI